MAVDVLASPQLLLPASSDYIGLKLTLLTVWAPDGRSRMADRVWSEKDLIREAIRRLAVLQHAEEISGNVAATCRYYGISRNVFYRWKRRYEDEGLEGLKDRSSAPLYCPTVTHPDIVEKIIHLRQHYHFGPMKIRMYLHRYHDVEISASGVWRILKRLGMNRQPASQRYKYTGRWKRYEKEHPGHYEDDAGLFNQKLKEWEDYYSYHGPTADSAAKPPTKDCYKRPRPSLSPATVSHTTM
jgi:transposase